MIRSHKIRLYPNNKTETFLRRCVGASRFAYNWGLSEWVKRYEAGEKVGYADISRALTEAKRGDLKWMASLPSEVTLRAISEQLKPAFNNFIKSKGRVKHPVFHKKGVNNAFQFPGKVCIVKDDYIRIPVA